MTKNIKDIPSSESRSLMKGYDEYVNKGYISPTTRDEDIGPEGCYGYQLAGPGVNEPYIYLNEVYHLNKAGNDVTYLNEYRYKIDGDTKDSKSEKYEDRKWRDVRDEITEMHTSIIDGGTIIPLKGVNSYSEAKEIVKQKMEEKNQNFAE